MRSGQILSALAVWALATTATGCRALVELVEADPPGATDDDIDVDARSNDPRCDTWPFAPATLDACSLPAPSRALALGAGSWVLDTNSGALTDPDQDVTFPASALLTPSDGPELRVVSIEQLALAPGATLRIRGERPLMLVAWSTAHLEGTLDGTSRAGAPAAGADPHACLSATATAGGADGEGAGGGGGGGLGTAGAAGGAGNDGLASAGTGGAARTASIALRGGCPGAAGGNPLAGAGGAGGGALYLAAREHLRIDGAILAGGAGGGAAQGGRSGGGGGGSGGVVSLAAPSIAIGARAILAANGGGGGGGSDGNPALPGEDGRPTASPAAPGAGQGMGSIGGAGGAAAAEAVAGSRARRGAGGGGGGVGRIVLDGASIDLAAGAVVSPSPR